MKYKIIRIIDSMKIDDPERDTNFYKHDKAKLRMYLIDL